MSDYQDVKESFSWNLLFFMTFNLSLLYISFYSEQFFRRASWNTQTLTIF